VRRPTQRGLFRVCQAGELPVAVANTGLVRSCTAVTGYPIHATDGEIGYVSGFLIDDQTWAIRCLVVDTSNWWIGHKVLVALALSCSAERWPAEHASEL